MMVIDNKFSIGQQVYLTTDQLQLPRIVRRLLVGMNSIIYEVVQGEKITSHYDFELSSEENLEIKYK